MIDQETMQEMNEAVENDFFAVSDFLNALINEPDAKLALLTSSIYTAANDYVDTPCEYHYIDIARNIEYARGYLNAVLDLVNEQMSAGLRDAIDGGMQFGGLHHDSLVDDEYKREYLSALASRLGAFFDENGRDICAQMSAGLVTAITGGL